MCGSKTPTVPDVSFQKTDAGVHRTENEEGRAPLPTTTSTSLAPEHPLCPGLSGHLLLVKETQKYESSPLPSLALALFESIRARLRVTRRKEAASEECVVQLRLSFRKNILKKKRFPPFFKDTLSLVLFASLVGDGGMVGGLSPPRLLW